MPAAGLAESSGALLWDSQVPCRKPALDEALRHLKARDGDTWQIQFTNCGFAVFNSACDLELTAVLSTRFNGMSFLDERMPVGTSGFIKAYHPRDVFTFVLNSVCTSYATDSANFISTHRGLKK